MIYSILLGIKFQAVKLIQNCTMVLNVVCLLAIYLYSQSLTIHDSNYLQKVFIKAPKCENSNSYLISSVRHSKAPLSLSSPKFDIQLTYCACLRHIVIAIIALVTTSTQSHSYHFVFCGKYILDLLSQQLSSI